MTESPSQKRRQKLFFVSGKGGVGKTLISTSLACYFVRSGLKCLLAELGEQSSLQYVLNQPIEHKPAATAARFDVCRWEGGECLREYIRHYIKFEGIVDLFFKNNVMKSLINAAPALKELALLGKATSGLREIGPPIDYDCIVVDCFATGHFKALMQAPIGMAEAISKGPMGEQSREIHKIIADPSITQNIIVTLPEDLPVNEAVELQNFLSDEFKQKAVFVLNKIQEFDLPQNEQFEQSKAPDTSGETWLGFIDFILDRHEQLQKSRNVLGAHGDIIEMPLIYELDKQKLLVNLTNHLEQRWKR